MVELYGFTCHHQYQGATPASRPSPKLLFSRAGFILFLLAVVYFYSLSKDYSLSSICFFLLWAELCAVTAASGTVICHIIVQPAVCCCFIQPQHFLPVSPNLRYSAVEHFSVKKWPDFMFVSSCILITVLWVHLWHHTQTSCPQTNPRPDHQPFVKKSLCNLIDCCNIFLKVSSNESHLMVPEIHAHSGFYNAFGNLSQN